MNKKISSSTDLSNPNDDSSGGCYAPIEKGAINLSKKKHCSEGKAPHGWQHVECDTNCQFIK